MFLPIVKLRENMLQPAIRSGILAGLLALPGLCCSGQLTTPAVPPEKPITAKPAAVATPKTVRDSGRDVSVISSGSEAGASAEPTTANPLKITLTASETPLKIGSTSNIAATIQNMSSRPVLIDLESVQLATHGIVATTTSNCVVAIRANYNESQGKDVVLQPQDQVSVMFNLAHGYIAADPAKEDLTESGGVVPDPANRKHVASQSMQCDPSMWGSIKRALDFSPGNYDYFVSGYFTQATASTAPESPNSNGPVTRKRPFTYSANFAVGIDQTTIIIFAVVGGWLALLVVTFNESNKVGSLMHQFASITTQSEGWRGFIERVFSSQGVQASVKFFIRMCGVAILSASFTIVSSRLSDTQLPVKITILDAWGAMTIGFVSFFVGQKFIAALASWGSSSKPAPTPEPRHTYRLPKTNPDKDDTTGDIHE